MSLWRLLLACTFLGVSALQAAQKVEVAKKPGEKFTLQEVRTLADLPPVKIDSGLNQYGGVMVPKQKATGFFRIEKIKGRWWIIDPEGGRFIHRGVASVNTLTTEGAKDAMVKLFKNKAGWAEATAKQLAEAGFNGTGSWCDDDNLSKSSQRMVSTKLLSLMAGYAKTRGKEYAWMGRGHMDYLGDCPFIFDPGFKEYCKEATKKLIESKDDPWLLGYYTDNEMPWSPKMLERYLALKENEPGRLAAEAWLKGKNISKEKITDAHRDEFLQFAAERYFEITTSAIRAVDPNHMVLGARFHDTVINFDPIFTAAGKYCDIVSVNYYRAWTPRPDQMSTWLEKSGKPFLITEWYAKGEDSGMANTGGAGWLLRTQKDRGLFYQHFALGLLDHPGCVGWHWFRYADNDPDAKGVDPSNLDSNKGIVTCRYVPYAPLLEAMKELNQRTYGLIEVLDSSSK